MVFPTPCTTKYPVSSHKRSLGVRVGTNALKAAAARIGVKGACPLFYLGGKVLGWIFR